jgi:hypothetical protein
MNESETRAKLIDPALHAASNGYVNHHNGNVGIQKNQTAGSEPDINQIP